MSLPDDLSRALQQIVSKVPRNALAASSEQLSQRYRSPTRSHEDAFMTDNMHRLAYLSVRLPATYAVVTNVLNELKRRFNEFNPQSICDLGAGPGTASWASVNVFPAISNVSLYEKDVALINLGKQLMQHSDSPSLSTANWKTGNLLQPIDIVPTDLTVLSYVVGELPLDVLPVLIGNAWKSTSVLVVIEPGTPHGFERIRQIRDQLIKSGAHLVAPCPHQNQCPMTKGDWCHFATRLERSEIHMSVKNVSMGYEDEKYSYVIASKIPVPLPAARILRHPQRHSGHVDLVLCTPQGLERKTFSRRHGALYKQACKCDWGDVFVSS